MKKILQTSVILSLFSTGHASPPTTADFDFLVGTWDLEAVQSPGTDRELHDRGTRSCKFVMEDRYLRCETEVERSNGARRSTVSLHNYNEVLGRYESLYYFSNWPVKPLAVSTLRREGDVIHWTNRFRFEIEAGQVERIRSEFTVREGVIENLEYLHRSDDPDAGYQLNYRERLLRRSPKP